jgi:hypothetical protein
MTNTNALNINRLIGSITDHEQEVYFYIKSILKKGFWIKNIDPRRLSTNFNTIYLPNMKTISSAEALTNGSLSILVESHIGLRGQILVPFYNKLFFKNDKIQVIYDKDNNKIFLQLLEEGSIRKDSEDRDLIFDTDSYLDKNKSMFLYNLHMYATSSITKNTAEFLSYLKIINMSEFALKKTTSISKGKLLIDSAELKKRITTYSLNFKYPQHSDYVKGFSFMLSVGAYTLNQHEYKMFYEKWTQKNINFWNIPEIDFELIIEISLDQGKL